MPATPNVEIDSITKVVPIGHVFIHGYGVHFKTHTVQATTDLRQAFITIGTTTALGDGSFQFDDPNAGGFTTRFHRVAYP